MKIGVIGAGGIGQAFAAHAAKAGYEVILSNRRGPDTLSDAARTMGPNARAATREEAATADIVFLSVYWPQVPEALAGLPAWNGRILIDATNAVGPGYTKLDLDGKFSSEVVGSHAPGARVVKAVNTLLRAVLAEDPHVADGHRVLFMSGDDAAAKYEVGQVLDRCGFATIDLGSLASGSPLQQFPGGVLPTLNLVKIS
jgi:predicted dinucleotide-binding enzyme